MIIINRQIEALDLTISYYIGKNAMDNFNVIDICENKNPNNIWFHVKDKPSSHVVAEIPIELVLSKRDILYIVKQGAILCKQYSAYKSDIDVPIIWTKIKNVQKLNIFGQVTTTNVKMINI